MSGKRRRISAIPYTEHRWNPPLTSSPNAYRSVSVSFKGVTDKNYITNSYHVHVSEEIDAFSKLKFESEFQKLISGRSDQLCGSAEHAE